MKYQKHIELVKIKNGSSYFFKKAGSDHHVEEKYGNTKDSDISLFLSKENVTKAEIMCGHIWILKTVMSAFSLWYCGSLSNYFQEMFPDSKIAQNFSLGKTKCL